MIHERRGQRPKEHAQKYQSVPPAEITECGTLRKRGSLNPEQPGRNFRSWIAGAAIAARVLIPLKSAQIQYQSSGSYQPSKNRRH